MTTMVTHVAGGKAAVFEKPASGDPLAPFNDPGQHLDLVRFHSDFDFYRRHSQTDVTVTLPSVAGSTRTFPAAPNLNFLGQTVTTDILLVSHDLGYVPNYQIIVDGEAFLNGTIQSIIDDAGGLRGRYLSHWADAAGVYLSAMGYSSDTTLAAASFSCTVVVFRLGDPTGNVVFDFDAASGRLQLGKGMFDSDEVLLRAQGQAGDTPYDVSVGPSMDVRNGRSRVARPSGTVTDEAGYNGSFVAPASFQGVLE